MRIPKRRPSSASPRVTRWCSSSSGLAKLAGPLLEVDFARTSLYEELATRCAVRPDNGWERIAPELPTDTQRGLLLLEAAEPVFAIERLALDGERPIEWRHSVVRGDRFAFVARWSGGDVDTVMETRG